jgi:hypothetical protein
MGKVSLELGLAIFGLVLTVVLLVLDKAEKLKGASLLWVLVLAAIMTLPLALGNPLVAEAPPQWKWWFRSLAVACVAFIYSAIVIWISDAIFTPNTTAKEQGASDQFQQPTFRELVKTVDFTLGDEGHKWSASFEEMKHAPYPLSIMGFTPIKLYVEERRLFADVTILDSPSSPIEVRHNEYVVRPTGWDKNSDSSALEIVDADLNPVFQMIYSSNYSILINGIFITVDLCTAVEPHRPA